MEELIRERLKSKNEADLYAILDFCKLKKQKAEDEKKVKGSLLSIIWEQRVSMIEEELLKKINNIFN